MDHLSAPLTEISEKLTTISTGKTCPYRRAILWTAIAVQTASCFSAQSIAAYIHPMVAVFLLAFSYIVISLAGETLIYRVIGKKESAKAQAEAVQEKYDMTLNELDTYIQKLANIRLLAATIGLASSGYAYAFYGLPWYSFWFVYLATTFVSLFYVRMRGKIKTPKRFFLFDVLKGQGEGLPRSSDVPGCVRDDRFNEFYKRYADYIYGYMCSR